MFLCPVFPNHASPINQSALTLSILHGHISIQLHIYIRNLSIQILFQNELSRVKSTGVLKKDKNLRDRVYK